MDHIPASDYDLLARYWKAEPWGPWRDNVHAALIATEMRRPQLKKGGKTTLSDFMLKDPEVRQQESASGFMAFFKAIANKRKRKN